MNMQLANFQKMQRWCRQCGAPSLIGSSCSNCQTPFSVPRERQREQALTILNDGNSMVQNNVVNVEQMAIAFADYEEPSVPVRQEPYCFQPQESGWTKFFRFTAAVASWMAIIVVSSIFLFLVCIVVMAFTHVHIG